MTYDKAQQNRISTIRQPKTSEEFPRSRLYKKTYTRKNEKSSKQLGQRGTQKKRYNLPKALTGPFIQNKVQKTQDRKIYRKEFFSNGAESGTTIDTVRYCSFIQTTNTKRGLAKKPNLMNRKGTMGRKNLVNIKIAKTASKRDLWENPEQESCISRKIPTVLPILN
ncbi:hypothetical protein AVEN_16478-1 [Araneus ventricosus]|uniref:Uncharacterized protein n=1 Tax=Araneus ventricosus TaxID=182803 RepID=A0A4Y2Q4R5_ARAVE|nr:hypothetical protein AVEN_16478-1 [Araneus ventricosus]